MIYFAKPIFLFYLLFIPFLILAHIISLRLRRKKALRFANFDAIDKIRGIDLLELYTDKEFVPSLSEFLKGRIKKKEGLK